MARLFEIPEQGAVGPRASRAGLIVCAVFAAACVTQEPARIAPSLPVITHNPEAVPWTSLEPLAGPDDFRFVVVSDRTGEHRAGIFESAMPKVNLLQPAFVMSVGDLIEGYTEDQAELDAQWDEIDGFVSQLEMPFFYLAGNHDMSNATMVETWRARYGPTYYQFIHKDVLFLALNSELFSMVSKPGHPVPGPDTQAAQMDWVRGVLADHPDVRWTIVFIHQPFWDQGREIHPDWLEIEVLLAERKHSVFAGHYHAYTKHVRHDSSYITLATTGGGSGLRGLLYGEFDHVAMVTMGEQGPRIANLLLDGIQDEDVRGEQTRAVVSLLETALVARALEAEPGPFVGGSAEFRVDNAGGAPLVVDGVFSASADIEPELGQISQTIAPGASAVLDIPLRAARPTPVTRIAPAHAFWTLRTQDRSGREIVHSQNSLLLPVTRFPCTRSPGAIEVDGSLEEWGTLRFAGLLPSVVEHSESWSGAQDLSYDFDVRCDGEFLYVGIDVLDDAIVASEDRIAREQDGIALALDGRKDPARSGTHKNYFAAVRDGTLASMLNLQGTTKTPKRDDVWATFMPPVPATVLQVVALRPGGYVAEFAIPYAWIDEKQEGPWEAIRLELSVLDFDPGEPQHATLWWLPSRFGSQALPLTGTFERP